MRLLLSVHENKSQASISIHHVLKEGLTPAAIHIPSWPRPSIPIICLASDQEDRKLIEEAQRNTSGSRSCDLMT